MSQILQTSIAKLFIVYQKCKLNWASCGIYRLFVFQTLLALPASSHVSETDSPAQLQSKLQLTAATADILTATLGETLNQKLQAQLLLNS